MRDITYAAEKRLKSIERDTAAQFDATILHNTVHPAIRENEELRELLDVAEQAYEIEENQAQRDDVRSAAFDAAETLNDHVDALVEDAVFQACKDLIDDVRSDDVDMTDWYAEVEVNDSFHAACAWVAEHPGVAERNGHEADYLVWDGEGSVEVDA